MNKLKMSLVSFFIYIIMHVTMTLGSESLTDIDSDCLSLGMNPKTLQCSSCTSLAKFNLHSLKDNCLKCCQSDQNIVDGVKKYPKARLEVCACKLGAFPQVQAFIKSDKPAKFTNFEVKILRNGEMPVIKLLDDKSNVEETLSINKWDTDTIVEFLSTYLQSSVEEFDNNTI